ncbi:hypothetical protein A2U01_0055217, partial [Trifolium medium]|nr:hypothetical protein [Trifolium medium]
KQPYSLANALRKKKRKKNSALWLKLLQKIFEEEHCFCLLSLFIASPSQLVKEEEGVVLLLLLQLFR